MSVKRLCLTLLIPLLWMQGGWTIPPPLPSSNSRSSPALSPVGDDLNNLIRQFRTALSNLKTAVNNHEMEIRTFEDKLQNQETLFEHMREEITNDVQSQRDLARATQVNLERRVEGNEQSLKNLETLMRGLVNDVLQLKTQANDSVAILSQYKTKISELETLVQAQDQHMQQLEATLRSIIELIQTKETTKEVTAIKEADGSLTYKVQSGDSLGGIAVKHKVSLQALRKANPQLTSDRIIVGQTLTIPQS